MKIQISSLMDRKGAGFELLLPKNGGLIHFPDPDLWETKPQSDGMDQELYILSLISRLRNFIYGETKLQSNGIDPELYIVDP